MLAQSIRNVVIGFVALWTVGTSALVVTNFERNAVGVHRRHAHAIADIVAREPAPEPVMSPNPSPSLKRRMLRQKRCIARLSSASESSSTPLPTSSPASNEAQVNHPVNAAPPPPPPPSPVVEAPTSSSQPPPPVASPPISGGGTFTGEITYYDTGLGACGRVNHDSDFIAAASMLLFDGFDGYPVGANPNLNPICGRRARISFEGNTVEVEIVDRCVGCAREDLDLSPAAFDRLGARERGRLHGASWSWI